MYGAILGDIIGSPFEFDRGDKTKEFDLFSKGCDFTDDSVMTIAVGEALLAVGKEATVKEIEEAVVTNMQDWGKSGSIAGRKRRNDLLELVWIWRQGRVVCLLCVLVCRPERLYSEWSHSEIFSLFGRCEVV